MRIEKIAKRKRKADHTELMIYMGIALLAWAFLANLINNIVGISAFLCISGYALIFIQRNELGENRKQTKQKNIDYQKQPQTYVFSKNYIRR
jgi:uncharacterized membrane protein